MKREVNEWFRLIVTMVGFGVMIIFLADRLAEATDKSIANQDRMLCQSAQTTLNEKYLSKCACYYETDNVDCLQDDKNLTE